MGGMPELQEQIPAWPWTAHRIDRSDLRCPRAAARLQRSNSGAPGDWMLKNAVFQHSADRPDPIASDVFMASLGGVISAVRAL